MSPIPLFLRVGICAWEQTRPRKILVRIGIKLKSGPFQDRLENTVDYSAVAERVRNHFEGKKYDLIETIAEETIVMLMHFPRVEEIKVEVTKPHAMPECRSVSVKMHYTGR